MKLRALGFVMLAALATSVKAEELCDIVKYGVLIAQDEQNTFLGRISNSDDSQSIFNEYGIYGSEYSSTSIWNAYGTFGSEHSPYSPQNQYTFTPPMIIKNRKIIGYLTANKYMRSAVFANLLKTQCKDAL